MGTYSGNGGAAMTPAQSTGIIIMALACLSTLAMAGAFSE